jgi:valyl-tRNA synthetase
MSKVKGNVIDPLDLVYGATFADMVEEEYPGRRRRSAREVSQGLSVDRAMGGGFAAFGADAVRFTLATYPPSNKRIALAPKRIEGNRHFLNKIWNATRLALELLGDFRLAGRHASGAGPAAQHTRNRRRWQRRASRRSPRVLQPLGSFSVRSGDRACA